MTAYKIQDYARLCKRL